MKYKILFSDYDGTFQSLEWGEAIPEFMIEAVQNFRKAGGKFVLCSGRPLFSQIYLAEKYGLVCDANIASQGSVIAVDGKIIKKSGITFETVSKVIKILDKFGRDYASYIDGDLYYHGNSEVMQWYLDFYNATKIPVEDYLTSPITVNGLHEKIIITKYPDEDLSDIAEAIKKECGDVLEVNSGASTILELVDKTCTKYEACKVIADYFGIDEEDCITMGDSTNDLTLVKFGLAIGVEGGHPDLINAVNYVAPSIENFPVKKVIDDLIAGNDIKEIYKKR